MVSLRPIRESDAALLYRVYASTRVEEMALVDWTVEQKAAFLRMQFDAQHRHYQAHYSDARFEIVEWDGEPIGRLYVQRRQNELRIIDISLLPEYRGRGIGGALLKQLLDEAEATGRPVRIHVERFNPAARLYRRLGFVERGDEGGMYVPMERTAAQRPGQVKIAS
jgi:RimJ/RimL family protein N-acetyltransferase